MNKTKYFLLSLLAVLSLAACSTDGDLITAGGVPAVELSSSGDVVLDRNNTSGLALTLYWTDNSRLTTSDGRVQTPVNATANTLQFSATEDFSSPIEVLTDAGTTSLQYTAESLNALAGRLDLPGDAASTLYIRMKSVLADNLAPAYSNVCRLQVTPYRIDMSRASILASDRTDTGKTLCSPESNGIYSGFMQLAGKRLDRIPEQGYKTNLLREGGLKLTYAFGKKVVAKARRSELLVPGTVRLLLHGREYPAPGVECAVHSLALCQWRHPGRNDL